MNRDSLLGGFIADCYTGNNLCRSYPTGLCKAATEVLLSPMMLNASERLLVDPAVFC